MRALTDVLGILFRGRLGQQRREPAGVDGGNGLI